MNLIKNKNTNIRILFIQSFFLKIIILYSLIQILIKNLMLKNKSNAWYEINMFVRCGAWKTTAEQIYFDSICFEFL